MIHNKDTRVEDGRHRLRAAIKLGIEQVEVQQHDLTEDEEMKFVRDTAIERRNLTPAQRMHIVLSTEELVSSIYEEGMKAKIDGAKNGGIIKNNSAFTSTVTKVQPPHNSSRKLAEIAGVSSSTIKRMKRIKKEEPELYRKVVEGSKSVATAYNELPKKTGNNLCLGHNI
ncbi:hypothetical protein ACIQZG_23740 [Lysinibacillus sp. NPDC096418]|uniref:hypothetical protein n=1 Tax=Lysinibacillus sp. NPDC096418 TaxID=3364138 RepID=UPI00382D81D1